MALCKTHYPPLPPRPPPMPQPLPAPLLNILLPLPSYISRMTPFQARSLLLLLGEILPPFGLPLPRGLRGGVPGCRSRLCPGRGNVQLSSELLPDLVGPFALEPGPDR